MQIPSALRSYARESKVDASGSTLALLLTELERHDPGLRLRLVEE